jgi:mannose-6-phosphate isomerase-like protein (cupin superfamily)/carbon monoxide dehydrogenase subunit G
MIAANLRHRAKRPELLAILGIAGVAAFAGAVVARQLRSISGGAPDEPRMVKTQHGVASPLIGHEFSAFGHRFHIIESSRDTDDGSLRFDYSATPRANVSEHTHHYQEESFEVVSGKLGLRVGGQDLILTPGQSATGPPGVPHAWWNPSDEERVRFLAGIRPGLDVETMLETVLGLMREGKTIGPVPRNPLQIAVLAREIGSWLVLTPVENVLFAPVAALALVGELLGYRARYPKYSGPDGQAAPVGLTRIERSVEIERTPEEVFAFVADLRNDPRWNSAIDEVQQTSEGPPGMGTTLLTVAHFLGRRFETPEEVTEYEPGRKLSTEVTSGPLRFTGSRTVEGVAGGTRLTLTAEGDSGGFFGIAEPIFARLATRRLEAELAKLKDLLEVRASERATVTPPQGR